MRSMNARQDQPTRPTRWATRVTAALFALALLVAGCTTGDDDSMDSTDASTTGDGAGEQEPAPEEPGDMAGDDGAEAPADDADRDEQQGGGDASDPDTAAAPVVLPSTELGRSIIYTADVDIEVDDVSGASRQAQQAVAAAGGLVFSQNTTSDPRPRTTLVFKVPPESFDDAMERLEGIGTMVNQDISADDVTDRVVDLESRIRTAEVSVERLRSLLEQAETIEAVASIESQLLERETNLEQLRGQLRTVQSQVSLATITVTITEEGAQPEIDVTTTAYAGDDQGDRCPGEARLETEEDESVIVCVAIDNTGNVDLADIEVRDLGLDLRREDFALIDFGDDDVLAPEETVIAWARFDASPGDDPRPDVTTVPVDDDGEPIRQSTMVHDEPLALEVAEDDSLPGLGDSLGYGLTALQQVFGVVLVAVGAAAPFVVIAAIPAGIYLWWRRRDQAEVGDEQPATTSPTD